MEAQMLQIEPQCQVTTLAVKKFSSATTSDGYPGRIPWSHLTGDALFASFSVASSQSNSGTITHDYRFKVVDEPQILVIQPSLGEEVC